MRQNWPSWRYSAPMEVLDDIQSTFWAQSCMICLLGDILEQNEPTLAILVLVCPNEVAGWPFRDQSSMIGLLGGVLEQNEPTLLGLLGAILSQ